MGSLPLKPFFSGLSNFTPEIERIRDEFKTRLDKQNVILRSGNLDSPYFPEAIDLGEANLSSSEQIPLYKVNAPGYFYLYHYSGAWDSTTGKGGVFVAKTAANLKSESTRMLYFTGADDVIAHGNNLVPILPSTSTYAYVVRQVTSNVCKKRWLFVPTAHAASFNIYSSDYLSEVGTVAANSMTKLTSTILKTGGLDKIQEIFKSSVSGQDWRNNFKSVCGYNVAAEQAEWFLNPTDYKKFVAARVAWIKSLGAWDPTRETNYGYSDK